MGPNRPATNVQYCVMRFRYCPKLRGAISGIFGRARAPSGAFRLFVRAASRFAQHCPTAPNWHLYIAGRPKCNPQSTKG
eukprot:9752978-Alexandrium_andersonii.AAC.1